MLQNCSTSSKISCLGHINLFLIGPYRYVWEVACTIWSNLVASCTFSTTYSLYLPLLQIAPSFAKHDFYQKSGPACLYLSFITTETKRGLITLPWGVEEIKSQLSGYAIQTEGWTPALSASPSIIQPQRFNFDWIDFSPMTFTFLCRQHDQPNKQSFKAQITTQEG